MSYDRYNIELRRQRLARRKRQVRNRIAILLGSTALVLVLIISLSVHSFMKHKSAKKQDIGVMAVQSCYDSFKAGLTDAISATAGTDEKDEDAFGKWFMSNYESEREQVLAQIKDEKISADGIYEAVGESMHVVYDRYKGYLEDADTAAAQGIYLKDGKEKGAAEVLVAGDLCLAEDGFVLDYYDTVNELSECIAPEILDMSKAADVFYLNHEYSISNRGILLDGKLYTFRAKPKRMELLKEMGTDLVSLANNHVYDYGEDAFMDTLDLLENAEIPYVGGGKNIEEAKRPIYYIVNGIKIGFVAASNAEIVYYTPAATDETPGILDAYDTTLYNQVISDASKQCDYLIAYIHWGPEDTNQYEQYQQDQGAEFLEAGADIVVGGHPHVLQGIEYIDQKPVVYSMGDFWFNDETKYTGMLKLDITYEGLKEMSFVPCQQTDYTTQYISGKQEQSDFYDFLQGLSPNAVIDANGVIKEAVQ